MHPFPTCFLKINPAENIENIFWKYVLSFLLQFESAIPQK